MKLIVMSALKLLSYFERYTIIQITQDMNNLIRVARGDMPRVRVVYFLRMVQWQLPMVSVQHLLEKPIA